MRRVYTERNMEWCGAFDRCRMVRRVVHATVELSPYGSVCCPSLHRYEPAACFTVNSTSDAQRKMPSLYISYAYGISYNLHYWETVQRKRLKKKKNQLRASQKRGKASSPPRYDPLSIKTPKNKKKNTNANDSFPFPSIRPLTSLSNGRK